MNTRPDAASPSPSGRPGKSALIIGIDPVLIDFSAPDFAAVPGMNAAKVMAGLNAGVEGIRARGVDAHLCLTDLGQTAGAVVTAQLQRRQFDCILIGAGIRVAPSNFLLFEQLINVVHEHAPRSRICFNTKPADTLEALERWL